MGGISYVTKLGTIPISFPQTGKSSESPCLGILAADGQTPFRGNHKNFADIARVGESMGVSVLIITPRSFLGKNSNGWIKGYRLHPRTQDWLPTLLPPPRVIYNRLPNRKVEQRPRTQQLLKFLHKSPHIHLFNPGFFNKWHIH